MAEPSMITLIEPIEAIKTILEWIKETPGGTSTISYSPEFGWSMTTFIDSGDSE